MVSSIVRLDSPSQIVYSQQQADSDDHLIELWLFGRPRNTERGYRFEVKRFREFVGSTPFRQVRLGDLQNYLMSFDGYSTATLARAINAIKSLWSFGHRLGYFVFNVAAALKAPKVKDTLNERILSEHQVDRILRMEGNLKHRIMLTLLYVAALRESELCNLKWRDCRDKGDGALLTIYGKGDKTRHVLISADVWEMVQRLSVTYGPDEYVFPGEGKGGRTAPSSVWRIFKKAAKKAGLPDASPHWFRHAHATHALDRGAPISLVKDTLGHANVATTSRYLHTNPEESSSDYLGL